MAPVTASASVGFCAACGLIRQDDEYGPVTPCACFVEHHADDCRLRVAVRSWIAIACAEHGRDSCPTCFSCTCGVAAGRTFVCGTRVFAWEPEAGLVPLRTT